MKKSKKSHRPKWKTWKRVLSVVLSTAVTVTSIPIMEAHAANTLPDVGLETYDYTRMESIMQDGKELSYLNNSTGAQKISSPMSFGEMVYLQFALPYNTYYDAKVYDASGNDLGYMYAKFYTEHLDGSIDSGFTSRGKSLAQIKQELKNFVYEMPYTWSNKFTGIGLTGETIPYSTLSEYYTYYGMENPDDKAVVLQEYT